MDRWIGTTAVVTGASSGIGAAICEKFCKIGINVVGLARRVAPIQKLSEELSAEPGKLHAMFCDLSQESSILEAFAWIEENFGGVSILINNAGLTFPTMLTDGDTNDLRTQLNVNVLGLCICTKEAVKSMKKHELNGHIVHMNSVSGHNIPEMPTPCLNIYPATKFAVTALTELHRKEFRAMEQPKIKVSSVSPGFVKTEFAEGFPTAVQDVVKESLSLSSEDVADVVAYVIGTPPHVQVHEIIVKVYGELF